jgi:DNA-binding NtrC family response regulator
MRRHVLLVDIDRDRLQGLRRTLTFRVKVEACTNFAGARTRLLVSPPDLLVTNSRLGAYNGLHLAHIAKTVASPTRVVVYGDTDHAAVARESRIAGAFYVSGQQIAAALPAYVDAKLPPRDRREVSYIDRRQLFRGGRRASDFGTSLGA